MEKEPEVVEAVQEGEEKMSKAQLKKLAKQKEKEAQKAKNMEKQANQGKQEDDYSSEFYGNYGVMGSFHAEKALVKIKSVDQSMKDSTIWIRGRVSNIRQKGNLAFVIMRDNMHNVQCVASKSETVSKQMLKFISGITKESIIDIQAKVVQPEEEVLSCT